MVVTPPVGGHVMLLQRRPRCHLRVLPADVRQLAKSRVFSVSSLETVMLHPGTGALDDKVALLMERWEPPSHGGVVVPSETAASQTRMRE
jgi:hypothetical protein